MSFQARTRSDQLVATVIAGLDIFFLDEDERTREIVVEEQNRAMEELERMTGISVEKIRRILYSMWKRERLDAGEDV